MSVMFFHGTVKEDFDARWKSRHLVKEFMEHKVTATSAVCVRQDAYRSWKVMQFKIQTFQAWQLTELVLGPGKSWKINQMVALFQTRVHVFGLYIHYRCPPSDSVRSIV